MAEFSLSLLQEEKRTPLILYFPSSTLYLVRFLKLVCLLENLMSRRSIRCSSWLMGSVTLWKNPCPSSNLFYPRPHLRWEQGWYWSLVLLQRIESMRSSLCLHSNWVWSELRVLLAFDWWSISFTPMWLLSFIFSIALAKTYIPVWLWPSPTLVFWFPSPWFLLRCSLLFLWNRWWISSIHSWHLLDFWLCSRTPYYRPGLDLYEFDVIFSLLPSSLGVTSTHQFSLQLLPITSLTYD